MDFFDPTDWRYEYRLKKERKNTAAKHSPQIGCDLLSLDSHSSRPSIPRYRQPLRIQTNSQNLRNLFKIFNLIEYKNGSLIHQTKTMQHSANGALFDRQ